MKLRPAGHPSRADVPEAGRPLSVVNPLGRSLAHYDAQVSQTLARLHARAESIAGKVSLDSEAPLAARARSHLGVVRDAARTDRRTVVLWPAFGYLEPALWRAARARATVIMHDPEAMRRQHGYGAISRRAGRWGLRVSRVRLVCHTRTAAEAVSRRLGIAAPSIVLHPIRTAPVPGAQHADPAPGHTPNSVSDTGPSKDPVVLVAGQYKPSRDLALLESLGPALRRRGIQPRIIGRGWPAVDGWEYRDEFVPEQEFVAGIRTSAAVLVPYRTYWQSGVAVQALEEGTPVVGYPTEFLRHMHGDSHPGYVHGPDLGEWIAAIERASSQIDQTAIQASRIAYQTKVDQSWQTLTA